MDDNGVSDKILDKAQKDLAEFLEKNNIPKAQKMMLEMQGYLLMVIINDHKKTSLMYPIFKQQQKRRQWWDKLQWGVIPSVALGVLTFVWQAIYFWVELAPKLSNLP